MSTGRLTRQARWYVFGDIPFRHSRKIPRAPTSDLASGAAVNGSRGMVDPLVAMVEAAILSEIDAEAWGRAVEIEELERETLASIVALPFSAGTTYQFADDPQAAA